ncbi:MAG: lipocalin-like domain-containing protein [Anaerolineales bacterium]
MFAFFIASTLTACAPQAAPIEPTSVQFTQANAAGFTPADGSRPLAFPADFGAHSDFRTEWWYYTGNLDNAAGRHFGFELTIFRAGLIPPTTEQPADSNWYSRDVYFAHFALSDIQSESFYAFERYSRPGPGLAGAQSSPYRVWLEDWSVEELASGSYHLQAAQGELKIELALKDDMGIILHGEEGYSRKGNNANNASYYYSQPRLQAQGAVTLGAEKFEVSGLTWKDHEFSTGALDENQIGWDWFSLQFDDGSALMLFQLRERGGGVSASSSGTFIHADGTTAPLNGAAFSLNATDEWRSPHSGGTYPASWQIQLAAPNCALSVRPWMNDQEINFPAVTYWEGAVKFTGVCNGAPTQGNGYVELTGYAGNLPLP